jgi:Mycotoxin biosynthesis protein UstYa
MFTIPFSRRYSSIAESDDTETFLSSSEKSERYSTPPNRTLSPYVIAISLLLASVATITLGFCVGQRFPSDLDETCTRHTSKYCRFPTTSANACNAFLTKSLLLAPILDENIISYDVVEFDGRFTRENAFRQDAGPEVDAAWEGLGVHCKLTDLSI